MVASQLKQMVGFDSTSIMELDDVPQHLLVVGGGYIGLEFGQLFRRFGSQVTVTTYKETLIDFSKAQVANYSCNYTDPEDPTRAQYDIRMALVVNGNPGTVTSRRFLVTVRRIGGEAPILPTTLDTVVSK